MNSLYGKFGQRQNVAQTEFVSNPSRFYEILLNDQLKDINLIFISDQMVQVTYKYRDHFTDNSCNTNIFIALFTTANARLRLYDKLVQLDKAVLYSDTDSIMYYATKDNEVKTGDLIR